jgi:signal transduction histidine kinase
MTNTNLQHLDLPGAMGLHYIAKVTASISHEMKNVLAIINENKGLLEDLSFAAKRGRPIEPERLERTCGQMSKQIDRADSILKTMSRFAHSFDHPEAPVDLFDLCQLVATLAGRIAAQRKVILQVCQPAEPQTLARHPFAVQNQLWRCLELAIAATSEDTVLTIKPQVEAIIIEGFDHPEVQLPLPAELPATVAGSEGRRQLILHLT